MTEILAAETLTRHYSVKRGALRQKATLKAVDGIGFTLSHGKTLAVVGESGSGKSTLGRMITLIEPPTSGRLEVEGIDAARPDRTQAKQLRRAVQMIFQDPYGSLNPRTKIGTNLEESPVINTRSEEQTSELQ